MRKETIRLHKCEKKTTHVMRQELMRRYSNTKVPGDRAIQEWIKAKEQIEDIPESKDAVMRNRTSPAKKAKCNPP